MAWEALRMIKGMWGSASFSHDGEYFKCTNVELGIPLVQKPHPPIWMPTRGRESIEEAASTGVSTIQWVPPTTKVVRAAVDHYHEVHRRAHHGGRKPPFVLRREYH